MQKKFLLILLCSLSCSSSQAMIAPFADRKIKRDKFARDVAIVTDHLLMVQNKDIPGEQSHKDIHNLITQLALDESKPHLIRWLQVKVASASHNNMLSIDRFKFKESLGALKVILSPYYVVVGGNTAVACFRTDTGEHCWTVTMSNEIQDFSFINNSQALKLTYKSGTISYINIYGVEINPESIIPESDDHNKHQNSDALIEASILAKEATGRYFVYATSPHHCVYKYSEEVLALLDLREYKKIRHTLFQGAKSLKAVALIHRMLRDGIKFRDLNTQDQTVFNTDLSDLLKEAISYLLNSL